MEKCWKKLSRVSAIWIFAVFFLAATLFLLFQASPASALERDGRWIKYNGSYPYLVGYDLQEFASNKFYSDAELDYKLNQLQEFNVSAIRLWANTWFMGENGYYPWTRDGNGKFNLNSWDSTYWNRIRSFVQKSKDRGIIIEFAIFAEYPKAGGQNWWAGEGGFLNAWNSNFNNNGFFSPNGSGHFYPQFFDLNYQQGGARLADYQQALIDKSINELNGYGNVYFQVHNEFPAIFDANGAAIAQHYPWQQHWAQYIHDRGALVSVHAQEGSGMNLWGVDYFKGKYYVDALNFHYYSATGGYPYSGGNDNIDRISAMLHGLQNSGQILQNDESHKYEDSAYTNVDTREAWASFVSGAYYLHYSEALDTIGDSVWRANAERIKVLRNISQSVNFWQMSPVDSSGNEYDFLISEGPANYWQVLANPGNEYVAYFTTSPSSNSVKINLPSGSYDFKFYDTISWNSNGISSGSVTGGGTVSITSPSTGSWTGETGLVLVIKKSSSAQFCGDQSCNNGETCSNCSEDCGSCPTTCSSFEYSTWEVCQPSNTQTRTIISSIPSGCTGGNPITIQSCTYEMSGYTYCATEGDPCSFTGTREVKYGVNSTFSTKTFTNGTQCDNTVFSDPLVGVTKYCYYSNTPIKKYNLTDFTNLVTDWLKSMTSSPADTNLDGRVDSKDLGIMMSNWAL